MRFHGLMMVRDDGDVFAQCLSHILTWCDALYVYDLGSTDNTWDIIQEAARKDKRVVPYMRRPTIYQEGLRQILFHKYRDRFETGDWLMKVDADEFYEVPPPRFVEQRVRPYESRVDLLWYIFRLTNREVESYGSDAEILRDRLRPIQERRRFYKIASYFEPRLFRYRRSMRWLPNCAWPNNAGVVAEARIPVRHYPHRDPLQMQARYRLRHAMIKMGTITGPHWQLEDWHKDVVNVDQLAVRGGEPTSGEGLAAAWGHTDGELREWIPGTPLPEIKFTNHLGSRRSRIIKRLLYGSGAVRLLDGLRPALGTTEPRYIDEAENAKISAN